MTVGQAGDFRIEYQRLDLALDGEVVAAMVPVIKRAANALDLDLAERVRYPLGGLRLGRLQEDFGGGL